MWCSHMARTYCEIWRNNRHEEPSLLTKTQLLQPQVGACFAHLCTTDLSNPEDVDCLHGDSQQRLRHGIPWKGYGVVLCEILDDAVKTDLPISSVRPLDK